MSAEQCFIGVCFIPLNVNAIKFFGFSEYLTGLALMVLAWTIADVRYRFRIKVAPIPMQELTFGVVVVVGVLTLLTDLWRAQGWLVPQGNILTPASWQALLASLFLLTFLAWAWFAFIRPSTFSKLNAERYTQTLYRFILKGNPAELAVIADELTNSALALVRCATDRGRFKHSIDEQKMKISKVEAYANDLLLLIADKRFCRAVVDFSPSTALAIFKEIEAAKKYGIQISTFAKNIVNEALANKDSFLYHEAKGYESGLIGYHKPLSQAMFGNHRMVETIGSLLDPDILGKSKWDAQQWQAYCRVVLLTFSDYVEKGHGEHSYSFYRAKGYIESSVCDLYKLNGVANSNWDDDLHSRLRVIVQFIKDAVERLEKKGVPEYLQLRIRDKHPSTSQSVYDHIANLIFEVIFAASAVTSPRNLCWWIQRNSVWGELFNFSQLNGNAGAVIKFKVRRLLYNEVAEMDNFPNFKGARIIGFCLNVMGLSLKDDQYDSDSRALHKVILSWTKKNYVWLHGYNPRIADACLVEGLAYDAESFKIVSTFPAEGLRREPQYVVFDLDPTP